MGSQLTMGGGGKLVSLMIDNLLHLKVNTIVVVLIATTIPWLSVSVQGLPTDQAENQLGSLSAPEQVQDSAGDANSGQKRFSSLLEWMRNMAESGEGQLQNSLDWPKTESLLLHPFINDPMISAQVQRVGRGGSKMWSKGGVKDNDSRFNNRKIFIRI